jgi:hypothetical protein
MHIQPRPDQELKIQEALQSGLIERAEDVLDAGLEIMRERFIKNIATRHRRTQQEAATHILEMRKNNILPEGVTIRDLINDGRA